jgi:hypothetical protein
MKWKRIGRTIEDEQKELKNQGKIYILGVG